MNYFEKDNFTSRRTTGNNMYDPESLITGAEAAAGFTYDNSHRQWASNDVYYAAVHGIIPHAGIPAIAPRVFNDAFTENRKRVSELLEKNEYSLESIIAFGNPVRLIV